MNILEAQQALANMVVVVDTREQPTPKLKARLEVVGAWERGKVFAGDYTAKFLLPSGEWVMLPVSIERKMGLEELSSCFCQERDRFQREFDRAKANGIKMYLLIENASIDDAYNHNYQTRMRSESMVASIWTWAARYNCPVEFCSSRRSGHVIHDILYREGKQFLEGIVDE